MQVKRHWDTTSHSLGWQVSKGRYVLARIWKNVNHHTLLVGIWIGAATLENRLAVPQKFKQGVIWSTIVFLGTYSKERKKHMSTKIWPLKTYKRMIKAALFITAKRKEKWKYLSTDEKIPISPVQFSCSVVSDSATPWTAPCQAFLSIHQLPEFTQTHAHWVSDAIQPSHPLLSPSPTFNLCQHQGLFK